MPYKNKIDKIENSKKYLEQNREEINKNQRDRWKNRSEEQIENSKEKRREWVEKNKEEINKKRGERKKKHKEYLIEMLGGKCCGCSSTENLQFDHLDRKEKKFNISTTLAHKLEKLIPEAKKCQLLCNECHKLKTLINHDCEHITYGKKIVDVKVVGNRTIVTLEELAQYT